MKKKIRLLAFSLLFASSFACAWTFLIAPVTSTVMWLGRVAGTDLVMARALEISAWTVGSIIAFVKWDTPTSTQPGAAKIAVSLDPNAKRTNPDPSKFNDPSGSQRDVTPKPSFPVDAGLSPQPATYTEVINAGGGVYSNGSAPYYRLQYVVSVPGQANDQYCTGNLSLVPAGYSMAWYGDHNGVCTYVISKSEPLACPAGYVNDGNNGCTLNDTSQVQKPADTVPCEVLKNSDGTWNVDNANPACSDVSAALQNNGSTLQMDRTSTSYDTVKANTDGTYTLTASDGNVQRTIQTGPYSSSSQGYPITSITDGPATPSGSGSSFGTGGGTCGGPNQPKCAMDDSGFSGADGFLNGKLGDIGDALDARQSQLENLTTQDNAGVEGSWITGYLPGPVVACKPIPLNLSFSHGPVAGTTGSASVDICAHVTWVRELMAWFFGACTLFYIFRVFTRSNASGAA